jgi:uridine kinase
VVETHQNQPTLYAKEIHQILMKVNSNRNSDCSLAMDCILLYKKLSAIVSGCYASLNIRKRNSNFSKTDALMKGLLMMSSLSGIATAIIA